MSIGLTNQLLNVVAIAEQQMAFFRAIGTDARKTQDVVERLLAGAAAFEVLLIEIDWPPPGHIPIHATDLMERYFRAGQLNADELSALFVEFYDEERLHSMLRDWKAYPWLDSRMQILEEAVACHLQGRYYASVCTMLPQIEGVVRDTLGGRKISARNIGSRLFSASRLGNRARDYYVGLFERQFGHDDGVSVPPEARHAILHGADTAFGTPPLSLKTVLTFDAVAGAAAQWRAKQTSPQSASDE